MYARGIKKENYDRIIDGLSKNGIFDPVLCCYLVKTEFNGTNYILKAFIGSNRKFIALGATEYIYDKRYNCHKFIEVRGNNVLNAISELLLYQYSFPADILM